ncbi:ABC transporter ATP-binding protein [Halalkalibacter wakoensis JCM 9140]|uniref:ABC transporter ATP-binding protein n=1 Tax=Halalkalibacter wakoensis JCM 9140 TaxID=1236970 RepID=W4PZ79_9BACI|nr:ABC transporter ATP-binding protein [Halalkalibacter wakoensis]GAE24970.1 ABC transporter ATP-binding protein [Halalkalibacter wakoensis JCM 9140]
MNIVEFQNVTKKYGPKTTINNLSFAIEENKITGIIGRNGAGKTTTLKMVAGHIKQTSGDIVVFGENPFNSLLVSANMIFVHDQMNLPTSLRLTDILKSAEMFYVNWDSELAGRLFRYFSLDPKQTHDKLSKGMKSTFNMIVGLASRCPLTIFDEPTTGMDAAVRSDFYRALLKDYLAHPRTILISSHHLNEIEELLEDILLIKEGQNHLHLSLLELKEMAIGLSGNKEVLQEWMGDREVYYRTRVGLDDVYVVTKNTFTKEDLAKMTDTGVAISAVSPNDLCVYLTSPSTGGIDDVFK